MGTKCGEPCIVSSLSVLCSILLDNVLSDCPPSRLDLHRVAKDDLFPSRMFDEAAEGLNGQRIVASCSCQATEIAQAQIAHMAMCGYGS